MWYHVAEPNSYLVITGVGIQKVLIKKKAFVYPLQKVSKISITPFDFSMSLQAMTIEKLKFSLPAVFTIGPADNPEALEKYAVLLTGESDGRPTQNASKGVVAVAEGRSHVQDIVKGIIEGETRSIVSTMTMEELFRERRIFKEKVIQQVILTFSLFKSTTYSPVFQGTIGARPIRSLHLQCQRQGTARHARVRVLCFSLTQGTRGCSEPS